MSFKFLFSVLILKWWGLDLVPTFFTCVKESIQRMDMEDVLYYWPLPFRANFICLILEEANVPYRWASAKEVIDLKDRPIKDQPFPSMAPPIFFDSHENIYLNQMPVICWHLAKKYNLMPESEYKSNIGLKLLLDANDLLMEVTNYNGRTMWEQGDWLEFREHRLRRWFEIFEQVGTHFGLGHDSDFILGTPKITFADLITCAGLGTLTSQLPQLKSDFNRFAPKVADLCDRIADRPRIQSFLLEQRKKWANGYCGGQIEESLRNMLS